MYDVIVVGAGSSGAVIAARITEHSNKRVLLIEAGPDYGEDDVPADLRNGRHNSLHAHDWGYLMCPNAVNRLKFDYPRGKVVGGSSAVNTCIALRGRPSDYDEWGFAEWRWQEVLPLFRRLERDLDFGRTPWHGDAGPVPIRRFAKSELAPWQAAFVSSALDAGYPASDDSNDPSQASGIGPHAMNMIDGERMSVARCYLTPQVRARDNFELRANTLVHRVLVSAGRAQSLVVQTRGVIETLHAKQIVLAAGAIGTPGLLLRSGIGPKASVARLGVALTAEVPGVAEQLWEHPGSALFFRPRRGLSHAGQPMLQTLLRLDDTDLNGMYLQAISRVHLKHFSLPLVAFSGHVGKPRRPSRIVFSSAKPDSKPHIFARALEDGEDRKKMRTTLQIAARFATQGAMAKLATPFFPNARILSDDSALDGWMRRWSSTGFHPCGTAPMGVSTDAYGRVLRGLYVADVSLLPTIPMANTNLTAIMIGERFGEWFSHGSLANEA